MLRSMSSLATLSRLHGGRLALNRPLSRPYSGAGEEYYRMQKIHEGLKDVEALYAKYRMDLFTEHRQVDEMVKKGLLDDTFAANLKYEIDSRNEAAAAHWKRVFWFIGIPLIGLSAYNAYMLETKE